MLTIRFDSERCIKCAQCVEICPEEIITQATPHSVPKVQHISACILCGHCVSICPENAVLHSEFPTQSHL